MNSNLEKILRIGGMTSYCIGLLLSIIGTIAGIENFYFILVIFVLALVIPLTSLMITSIFILCNLKYLKFKRK